MDAYGDDGRKGRVWMSRWVVGWLIGLLLMVSLGQGGDLWAQSQGEGAVRALVQELEAGLNTPGTHTAERSAELAEALAVALEQIEGGEVEVTDELRYLARLTLTRYEVRHPRMVIRRGADAEEEAQVEDEEIHPALKRLEEGSPEVDGGGGAESVSERRRGERGQDDAAGAVAERASTPSREVRRLRRESAPAEAKPDEGAQGGGDEQKPSAAAEERTVKRLEPVASSAEALKDAGAAREPASPGQGGASKASPAAKATPEPPKSKAEVEKEKAPPVPRRKVRSATKAETGRFVFQWPVKHRRITSRFGMRRDPKRRKRRRMHKGLDLGGPSGIPVVATGPGKVLKAGRGSGGVGIQVVIQHADGWTSRYFHLSKVEVKSGTRVKAGQLIGRVGSTGRSTGPHLHFQVEFKGHAVNPERVLGHRSDRAVGRVQIPRAKKKK